jgi:hypothetical protein
VIHPHFPHTFLNWYVQNVKVGQFVLGQLPAHLKLGMEFDPFPTRSLLLYSFTPLALWLASLLGTVVLGVSLSRNGRFLVALASAFLLLTMISARFIEIFVPVAILASAVVLSEVWAARDTILAKVLQRPVVRVSVVALACLGLFVSHERTHRGMVQNMLSIVEPATRGVATWMRGHLPPRATVLHFEWDEFTELFFYDPDHYYLVALDPTFGYYHDPKAWEYIGWLHIHGPEVKGWEIKKRLGAGYAIAGERCAHTRDWWRRRPGVTEIYSDDHYSAFALSDSTDAGGDVYGQGQPAVVLGASPSPL